MAQKVNIILVDDLDGTEATETVVFGLDGAEYEIDLTAEHAGALRGAVEKYASKARKVSGRRGARKSTTTASASGSSDKTAVREWAKAQGMEVSERGRIPVDVQAAYDARGQDKAPESSEAKGRGRSRRSGTVDAEGKVKQDA